MKKCSVVEIQPALCLYIHHSGDDVEYHPSLKHGHTSKTLSLQLPVSYDAKLREKHLAVNV